MAFRYWGLCLSYFWDISEIILHTFQYSSRISIRNPSTISSGTPLKISHRDFLGISPKVSSGISTGISLGIRPKVSLTISEKVFPWTSSANSPGTNVPPNMMYTVADSGIH